MLKLPLRSDSPSSLLISSRASSKSRSSPRRPSKSPSKRSTALQVIDPLVSRSRANAPLKESAYQEGTFRLSPYSNLRRTSVEGAPERNSNMRCSMLTTIVPDSKAVVESEAITNSATMMCAAGLCAQVVMQESQMKDKSKVHEAVSSARRSFVQSGLTLLNEHVDKSGGVADLNVVTSTSPPPHSRNEGGYKGKRPPPMKIRVGTKEAISPSNPLVSQMSTSGNLCMEANSPGVKCGKRDLDTMLPSSLSPKWLQHLLQQVPKGKRSGSKHRRRASDTAASNSGYSDSITPRRVSK